MSGLRNRTIASAGPRFFLLCNPLGGCRQTQDCRSGRAKVRRRYGQPERRAPQSSSWAPPLVAANFRGGLPGSTPHSGRTPQPNARGTLKQNRARRAPLRRPRGVRAAHYRFNSRCNRTQPRYQAWDSLHEYTHRCPGFAPFRGGRWSQGTIRASRGRLASRSKRIGVSFSAMTGLTFDSIVLLHHVFPLFFHVELYLSPTRNSKTTPS